MVGRKVNQHQGGGFGNLTVWSSLKDIASQQCPDALPGTTLYYPTLSNFVMLQSTVVHVNLRNSFFIWDMESFTTELPALSQHF